MGDDSAHGDPLLTKFLCSDVVGSQDGDDRAAEKSDYRARV